MIIEDIKNHIATGVDAKIMQYEEHAVNISDDKIDIIEILGGKQNCILINMEKDVERYKSAINQLEKVSIKNFVHLKGTDGRNKNKKYLQDDLTYILKFLSKFNNDINPKQIEINNFSEINDSGVQIQDGPLGCYCSHLRALIYAYLNYEDYTIICEDDISITNTEKIENYIKLIPNDWDIICLNSRAKNISYGDSPFYKFTNDFHSLHFYIVRHKALPTIFKHMYPMFDQVDVLMSDMVTKLNIYNIPDTVYQKNIKTNTQNNLSIIFSSDNYKPVREALSNCEKILNILANKILPENRERNKIIVKNLIYDVIYNFMLTDGVNNEPGSNIENYQFDNIYKEDSDFILLEKYITFFLQCSRKGINPELSAKELANVCLFTLDRFSELHNKLDNSSEIIKAYGFGSTSHTYKIGNTILKKYNDKLRWATDGHDNIDNIINKELDLLSKIGSEILWSDNRNILMPYYGESLYNEFNLPKDWREQITNIFSKLTNEGVYYPEFRLQNILVLNGKIRFVDFGLSEFRSNCDNNENLNKFIKYLELMEVRFINLIDMDELHRLISTFSLNNQI